jgi:hypothetical protein
VKVQLLGRFGEEDFWWSEGTKGTPHVASAEVV